MRFSRYNWVVIVVAALGTMLGDGNVTAIQIDDNTAEGLKARANELGLTLQELLKSIAAGGVKENGSPWDSTSADWSSRLHAWAADFPARSGIADDSRFSDGE